VAFVALRRGMLQSVIVQRVTLAPEGDRKDACDRGAVVREDQSVSKDVLRR
jgi:hypothetical protein